MLRDSIKQTSKEVISKTKSLARLCEEDGLDHLNVAGFEGQVLDPSQFSVWWERANGHLRV